MIRKYIICFLMLFAVSSSFALDNKYLFTRNSFTRHVPFYFENFKDFLRANNSSALPFSIRSAKFEGLEAVNTKNVGYIVIRADVPLDQEVLSADILDKEECKANRSRLDDSLSTGCLSSLNAHSFCSLVNRLPNAANLADEQNWPLLKNFHHVDRDTLLEDFKKSHDALLTVSKDIIYTQHFQDMGMVWQTLGGLFSQEPDLREFYQSIPERDDLRFLSFGPGGGYELKTIVDFFSHQSLMSRDEKQTGPYVAKITMDAFEVNPTYVNVANKNMNFFGLSERVKIYQARSENFRSFLETQLKKQDGYQAAFIFHPDVHALAYGFTNFAHLFHEISQSLTDTGFLVVVTEQLHEAKSVDSLLHTCMTSSGQKCFNTVSFFEENPFNFATHHVPLGKVRFQQLIVARKAKLVADVEK